MKLIIFWVAVGATGFLLLSLVVLGVVAVAEAVFPDWRNPDRKLLLHEVLDEDDDHQNAGDRP